MFCCNLFLDSVFSIPLAELRSVSCLDSLSVVCLESKLERHTASDVNNKQIGGGAVKHAGKIPSGLTPLESSHSSSCLCELLLAHGGFQHLLWLGPEWLPGAAAAAGSTSSSQAPLSSQLPPLPQLPSKHSPAAPQ